MSDTADFSELLPAELRAMGGGQEAIPQIARTPELMVLVRDAARSVSTEHTLVRGDATGHEVVPGSIQLVVTSPPYWTLKRYDDAPGQLGHCDDYEAFLDGLDEVWRRCFDGLVPGGRLVCVVGDVCLSRRKNQGEHTVVPLHAAIQERCRRIGFSNVAPIIWHKISNAQFEVPGNGGFLGKPYEPNGIIKNDVEYILMLRKPGGYRKPTLSARMLSVISESEHKKWFQQIWTGLTGASTKNHPAPYPVELAERLIRMFSFVGDTVYDPFMGSGTTNLAACRTARNSIGTELVERYYEMACARITEEATTLFDRIAIKRSA